MARERASEIEKQFVDLTNLLPCCGSAHVCVCVETSNRSVS